MIPLHLIIFSVFLLLQTQAENSPKPHIIVIIADDMGYNDVGFHGSNQIPTPHIDALAYNGIILNRHYTQYVCTPSRAALLTGNYPIRSGLHGYPLRAGENRSLPSGMTTMPQHLKRLGYKTHLVGKWHLGAAYRDNTPTRKGFDTHFGYWNGLIGYFDHLSFTKSPNDSWIKGLDLRDQFEPVWGLQGQYATDLFTKRALEIIDDHDVEVPMFLVLSHLAPHVGKDGVELGVPNATLTDLKYSHIKDPTRRLYADVVNLLDDSVGQVIKKLSEKNMLNNSIVLFFSDNGGITIGMYHNAASNWPLRGMKFSLFEGGVRTAAVIFSPLFKKKGYVSKELIHLTDWLPTFYSAAGGDLEDLGTIDGIDQWKSLSENLPTNRTEILVGLNEWENSSALISQNGRYKLVRGTFQDGVFDMYYGENGRDPDLPPYDLQGVLNSTTNIIINNITKTSLGEEKIKDLRSQADLSWCRTNETFVNCTGGCLFDLVKDSCETTNIIDSHVLEVEQLDRRLEEFWSILVPLNSRDVDENSNPVFYNNTWCTWLDDELCFKTSNIEPLK